MSKELGRTVDLSQKTLTNLFLLKKVGVGEDTIKSFNKLYDTIGGTFEEATLQQMTLVNQAKSYGLNVSQFMSTVAGQLTKINQYGFPNGVKDLGEMVVKSKLLGDNISLATSLADKIMGSPETALDLAAQLQTLGGSFASLGDPMELLFLAQNDLAGLNDKLIDATKGLATFNKETGQFEIGINERMRIKEVGKVFGQDANSIIETATKVAKQQEILKQFNMFSGFEGLNQQQKDTLAAFAQIGKEGKVTIEGQSLQDFINKGPGEMQKLIDKLQGTGSLFDTKADTEQNNINMIQQNSSALERVNIQADVLKETFTLAALKGGEFIKFLDAGGEKLRDLTKDITDIKTQTANRIGGLAGAAVSSVLGPTIETKTTETAKPIETTLVSSGVTPKLELSIPKEPILVKLDSVFDVNDVVKSALEKVVNQKIRDEVSTQIAKIYNSGSGAAVPYATGTSTG
jgi:hypothetical protein